MQPPAAQAPAPYLNFAPIQNAAPTRSRVAERYEKAYASLGAGTASAAALAQINALLRQTDQVLLVPGGLPKRPWYQHALYAPGYYTGYGVKTLPGVREAIEQRDWKLADEQIGKAAAALTREAELIARAAQLLEQATNTRPVP
ncbi:MAG: transferrin receptor-like dimerization domain-containing protein [Gemmatimonadaceae bacterium]